jgi:hypothetical protein
MPNEFLPVCFIFAILYIVWMLEKVFVFYCLTSNRAAVGIVMSQPPQYKSYAATVTSAAGTTIKCGKQ